MAAFDSNVSAEQLVYPVCGLALSHGHNLPIDIPRDCDGRVAKPPTPTQVRIELEASKASRLGGRNPHTVATFESA
jgi:hypothetical protein